MGFGWDDSGEFRGGFGINSGDSKDENDFLGEIYHVGGFPGTKNQVPNRFYKEKPGNFENSRIPLQERKFSWMKAHEISDSVGQDFRYILF